MAGLRIAVFREWPYLYDGDAAYEREYLRAYAAAPAAAVVLCRAGDQVVGAATCQPMRDAHAPVRAAFVAAGLDPEDHCYFGESLLLPDWRGQGAGRRFFVAREHHASTLGLRHAAFCAVERAPDDPRRPPGHVPLDAFWRRLGYAPRAGMRVQFAWKEVGAADASLHDLSVWLKDLRA